MESLKDLLDSRTRLINEARGILDKPELDGGKLSSAQEERYEVIDKDIDALSVKIDAKRSAHARQERLSAYEGMLSEPPTRQTTPSHAGGETLSIKIGGRDYPLHAGTPEHNRYSADYNERFRRYLAGASGESLGLQVSSDQKGGYTAPTQFSADMIRMLDDSVMIRQLANVLPPLGNNVSLGVLTLDSDPNDADWTPEVPATDIAEDDSIRFGKREFMPHECSKLVKIGNKLIRSSVLAIEDIVKERVKYKFGLTYEKAYLFGDGDKKPLGLFTPSPFGISTNRDIIATSATAFTGDDLIEMLYSLKEGYQTNATWIAHRDWIKRVRKLKNSTNDYIWTQGLGTAPDTVLGRPVRLSEFAPNVFAANKYVAILGDMKSYTIADTLGWNVQRLTELFALRNQLGLIFRAETDGQPVREEAFVRMKMGV